MIATFAGYPLEKSYEGSAYRHGTVVKHADYIAKTPETVPSPGGFMQSLNTIKI